MRVPGVPGVPGAPAKHVFITDNCRKVQGGDEQALDEALERIRGEMAACLQGNPPGAGTKFHIIASVERTSQIPPIVSDNQRSEMWVTGHPDAVRKARQAVIEVLRAADIDRGGPLSGYVSQPQPSRRERGGDEPPQVNEDQDAPNVSRETLETCGFEITAHPALSPYVGGTAKCSMDKGHKGDHSFTVTFTGRALEPKPESSVRDEEKTN